MLTYLWRNRERPPLCGRAWVKNWGKRILLLPSLFGWSYRLARLRARGAEIGNGSLIAPAEVHGASKLSIGQNSFIGRVYIQAQSEVRIGSNVSINDGARLLTASHDVADPKWQPISKPIDIEDFAWIATSATILPGVRIGRGAVVGAGTVVARDVPPYAVATGNPAQVRENVRPKDLAYSPLHFLAVFTAWLGKPEALAGGHQNGGPH